MTTEPFVTCLWFDGDVEAAARYYVSVFPNAEMGDVSYYPDAAGPMANQPLTASFTANGQRFVALNGGPQFPFTEAISFQVSCADQDEVDRYWDRLVGDGGQEGRCAWLKDRYGVSWQIVPRELMALLSDPNPARAGAASQAMMQMNKIDVAAVRAAADAAG